MTKYCPHHFLCNLLESTFRLVHVQLIDQHKCGAKIPLKSEQGRLALQAKWAI